jgi:hypothetical protein
MSKRGLTAFQSIALLVVSLFAALALSWMTYDIGRNRGASEILDADIIRSGFEKQASTFQKTSRTIYQELLELQHQLKMEQAVQQELKSQIFQLQSELVTAREELTFYQQIVAPEKLSGPINLQSLKLFSTPNKQHYRYQIILVQTQQRRELLTGVVELSLDAQKGERLQTFSMKELSLSDSDPIRFSFRYFQTLEGVLIVPEGFDPLKIRLRAILRGNQRKGESDIDEEFDWSDLLQE